MNNREYASLLKGFDLRADARVGAAQRSSFLWGRTATDVRDSRAGKDGGIEGMIAKVVEIAQRKGGKAADKSDLARFIDVFFRGAPPEDLATRAPQELYDTAAAAWDFLQTRTPGKEKVRLTEGEGDRSIILIAQDDMPFLVA